MQTAKTLLTATSMCSKMGHTAHEHLGSTIGSSPRSAVCSLAHSCVVWPLSPSPKLIHGGIPHFGGSQTTFTQTLASHLGFRPSFNDINVSLARLCDLHLPPSHPPLLTHNHNHTPTIKAHGDTLNHCNFLNPALLNQEHPQWRISPCALWRAPCPYSQAVVSLISSRRVGPHLSSAKPWPSCKCATWTASRNISSGSKLS